LAGLMPSPAALPPMQFRPLGRTGLTVSRLSLGTGGPSRLGQSLGYSASESERIVRQALDRGINFFDTSIAYAESEVLLGNALRGVPRDAYLLATKWPPERDGVVNSDRRALAASVERSLRRLRVEAIDLMQLHGVVPSVYPEVRDRFLPELQALQAQGKILSLGITERFFADPAHEMLEMALRDDVWDAVMVKYGILNQAAARRVLPLAEQQNVGVLNMASVRVKLTRPAELAALLREWTARGLLPAEALPDTDPLGWLVGGEVESVIAAGYKFAAEPAAVSTVITGTANGDHLDANLRAILGPPLPAEHRDRLVRLFGKLAEGA